MVNLLHIELLPSNPGPGWILTICTLVCAPTLWFSSDSIEVKLYRLLQLGAYIMALYFTSTIVIELRRTGPIDFLRRVLAWRAADDLSRDAALRRLQYATLTTRHGGAGSSLARAYRSMASVATTLICALGKALTHAS